MEILRAEGLVKYYGKRRKSGWQGGWIGISFSVQRGEFVAGRDSGFGKTTLLNLIGDWITRTKEMDR